MIWAWRYWYKGEKRSVGVKGQRWFSRVAETFDVRTHSLYKHLSIIEVAPGESYTTKIIVNPLEDFKPGLYGVSLNVDSDFGERHLRSLDVFIGAQGYKDYLPTFKDTVDMDTKITPGETVSVKLFLENKNPLDL